MLLLVTHSGYDNLSAKGTRQSEATYDSRLLFFPSFFGRDASFPSMVLLTHKIHSVSLWDVGMTSSSMHGIVSITEGGCWFSSGFFFQLPYCVTPIQVNRD